MKIRILIILIISIFSFSAIEAHSKEIKIGLAISDKAVRIGSNEKAELINLSTNKIIGFINKKETYLVKNNNGLTTIINKPTNISLGSFPNPILLKPEKSNGLVFCNDKWYRGQLIIITNGDKKNITVINYIDLEDYLLSVVPSEIPSRWNSEALKAQTVAARSYSLGYLGRRKDKGYDLESTVEDQVYLGVAAEKWSTTKAVKDTKGIVLVDNEGNPLIALYHSSGGGYTDSIENLWDKEPSPHIQPRPDYDDKSPHFKWYRSYKMSEVSKLLNSLNIGNIINIIPLTMSVSKRVTWLEIVGDRGKTQLRGEELRKFLKLPSSKFNLKITNGVLSFAGRGYGHGLGLSQWGSKELAENGFNYRQILAHYYTGTRLVQIKNEE